MQKKKSPSLRDVWKKRKGYTLLFPGAEKGREVRIGQKIKDIDEKKATPV